MLQETQLCIMSKNSCCVIDILLSDGKTMFERETPSQVQRRYRDAEVMKIDAAMAVIEELHIDKEPEEITEDSFMDAYEALPPLHSIYRGKNHTFMMSEFYSGNITSIYAMVGNRYFTFHDRSSLSHDEIIRKCRMHITNLQVAAECDCV